MVKDAQNDSLGVIKIEEAAPTGDGKRDEMDVALVVEALPLVARAGIVGAARTFFK